MEKLKLTAKTKDKKAKDLKSLRESFQIPAVLYGDKVKNEHLIVDKSEFTGVHEEAGSSTLVDLEVEGKKARPVLIHDVQYHPVTDEVLHIDFYQVKMDQEIEAEVELEFTGTSPAVKDQGGVLVKPFDSLEVKCLPGDLPGEIKVDVSGLETFDDVIKVKDLPISDKVEVMQSPERVVATVTPPRSEEELAELDKEIEEDVEAVEGVKEEEPGAEGEEAAEGEEEKPEEAKAEGEESAPKPEESKPKE